jgi:hypothetical protein
MDEVENLRRLLNTPNPALKKRKVRAKKKRTPAAKKARR